MLNWRVYPFVRLILPLLVGILLSNYFEVALWWVIVGVLLSTVWTIGWANLSKANNRWVFGISLSLLMVGVGWLRNELQEERLQSNHFQTQLLEEQVVVGKVYEMPEPKNWLQVKLSVLQIADSTGRLRRASGNLIAYIQPDSTVPSIEYGDVLLFKTRIQLTQSTSNPHAFDFSRYLHFKNIHYQTFVRAGGWEVVAQSKGNGLLQHVSNLRKYFLEQLNNELSNENNRSIAAALLLGYRGEISEELRNAYADTGAIHILAVSGLHVGLIYIFISFLLRFFPSYAPWQKALKLLFALSCIWGFALLTGASASVLRASTMFTFIIIGEQLQRNSSVFNTIALAAFCSLLYNPYLLMDVGFQLSYLAVLGIVYFQPHIYKLLAVENKVLDYLWQITAVSIAAQLAVAPIGLYYFHQFPLYFWLSSAVVIPSAFVMLLLGVVFLLSSLLVPAIAAIIAIPLDAVFYAVNWCIYKIQTLPGGLLKGIWISGGEVLLLYGLLLMVALYIADRQPKWNRFALVFFALFLLSRTVRYTQAYFQQQVVVYDISEHTAIDLFDGVQLYSLQSDNLPERTLNFAAQQNRWAKQVQQTATYSLYAPTPIQNEHFFFYHNYFQFDGKRYGIINEMLPPSGKKLHLNTLILTGNPKLSIQELQAVYTFNQLIFDASNQPYRIQQWQAECETLGIPCEKVAFVVKEN